MSDMNGKVALITGASSGIGRATAELFAARGSNVVLAARREPELATLAREIESRGGKASFVVTDVAIARDVEAMVAHTVKTFGRLDYAVNNAGIEGTIASITDLPEEDHGKRMPKDDMAPGSRHQPEGHFSVFAARGACHACRRTGRCDR